MCGIGLHISEMRFSLLIYLLQIQIYCYKGNHITFHIGLVINYDAFPA
jgi:hypothetical protein